MSAPRPPAQPDPVRAPLRSNGGGLELEALAAAIARHLAAAMPTSVPEGALLDAEGAAALLNVPASWVLAEARADRVPHVRLGRYVRFDRAELEAWAAQRARGPRRRTGSDPVSRGAKGP